MRDLENKLIEKNQKIQKLEMKKKNEELCNHLEATQSTALGDELGQLKNINGMDQQLTTPSEDGDDDFN